MAYGHQADYSKGLGPRGGIASGPVLATICAEHLKAADSHIKWETGNYGIDTNMKTEFGLVAWEVIIELHASPETFPK